MIEIAGILDDIASFVKKHPYITAAAAAVTAAGITWVIAKNGKRIYTIRAGTKGAGEALFKDLLTKTQPFPSEVLLCDPYISAVTLKLFTIFAGKIREVKILTSNIKDPAVFNLNKIEIERSCNLSFKIRQNPKLHDRYILIGNRCLLIGTSLNYLGNKDTTIVEDNELLAKHRNSFEERWGESDQ